MYKIWRGSKITARFMLSRVEYNGFSILKKGVRPTIQKVLNSSQAEAPTNTTELRAFIGLANYLRSSSLYTVTKERNKMEMG